MLMIGFPLDKTVRIAYMVIELFVHSNDDAMTHGESGGELMAALSVEDKAKGKRIIAQFFRTMPGVQKGLLTIFEKDGYEGVFRLQSMLYPENATAIDSTDTLRKGLSMILQHIYGMPVEDKEGYFQEVTKCKTTNQVIRKEKETLVNYFYNDFADLKSYLRDALMEDKDFRLMNALSKEFIGEGEEVTDMRSFKNQIRNVRDAVTERINAGSSQDEIIETIKAKKEDLGAQPESAAQEDEAGAEAPMLSLVDEPAAPAGAGNEVEEKRRIIEATLNDDKYQAIRDVLLKHATRDPNFSAVQAYLDNILAPSTRFLTNSMETFSQGIQKIKAFRDNLERELSA
jgi:hypothetical protein